MKRFLLMFALCVVAVPVMAPEAFSQGANVITIIRDDGTKDVIELGGPPPPVPERIQRPPTIEVETGSLPAPHVAPEPFEPKIPPSVERVAKPESKPKIKPTVKPKAIKKRVDALAFVPPRKPYRRFIPSDEPITKDRALYIALNDAPPSRDVQVYPVQSSRGPAYSVLFKTEEGAYEVLVDAESGLILNSGAVKVEHSYTKPGHLPSR